MLGAGNSIQISHLGDRDSMTSPITCCLQGCALAGDGNQREFGLEPRGLIRDKHIPTCSSTTKCLPQSHSVLTPCHLVFVFSFLLVCLEPLAPMLSGPLGSPSLGLGVSWCCHPHYWRTLWDGALLPVTLLHLGRVPAVVVVVIVVVNISPYRSGLMRAFDCKHELHVITNSFVWHLRSCSHSEEGGVLRHSIHTCSSCSNRHWGWKERTNFSPSWKAGPSS